MNYILRRICVIVFLSGWAAYHFFYEKIETAILTPKCFQVDHNRQIWNESLGFQQVYALSMPTRADRRDAISLASSVTDFQIKFADGVDGSTVPEKSFPPGGFAFNISSSRESLIGNWRAHLNVLQRVVRERINTALIIEDDSDWDVRLKQQLSDVGLGMRTLQSSRGCSSNPYGDDWDILWLGHRAERIPSNSTPTFTISNDETVPRKKDLTQGYKFLKGEEWPEHTRVIHPTDWPVESQAYAVSFRGAQSLLYHLSVKGSEHAFDYALATFCVSHLRCFSVSPAVIAHRMVAGPYVRDSDISERPATMVRARAVTYNIVRSVQESLAEKFGTPKEMLYAKGKSFEEVMSICGESWPEQ